MGMSDRPKYLGKCGTCGVIVRKQGDYCSSGCHLAGKLPVGDQGLPASWQLGVVLAVGFALFNQMIFWLLAWRKVREEDFDLGYIFAWTSFGIGAAVMLFWVYVFVIARFKTWVDIAVVMLALGVTTVPARHGEFFLGINNLHYFFVGNCFMAIWFGRGLFALWLSKRREKGS